MPYSPVVRSTLRWLLPAVVLVCQACSSGPPPRLYVLEAVSSAYAEQQSPSVDAIGLSVVRLPGYATDARIASRVNTIRIEQSDQHRWAEPPEEAITRLLASQLRLYSDASVLVEPWPRGFDPDVRVEVVFDKLLRGIDGGVEMTGQINVLAGDGRRVRALRSFEVTHPGVENDPAAFFPATAAAVNDIARIALDAMLAGSTT